MTTKKEKSAFDHCEKIVKYWAQKGYKVKTNVKRVKIKHDHWIYVVETDLINGLPRDLYLRNKEVKIKARKNEWMS